MLTKFCIGDIDASTIPKSVTNKPSKQPSYNSDKTPEFIIKILQFAVPLGILGLALAVRYYTKVPA